MANAVLTLRLRDAHDLIDVGILDRLTDNLAGIIDGVGVTVEAAERAEIGR